MTLLSKILSFFSAAVLAIMVSACGGGSENTPESVAVSFIEASYEGDAKKSMELIDLSGLEESEAQVVEAKLSAMIEKQAQRFTGDNAVEKVEAIESKALDENLTRVKVKVTLKNGKTKNESIKVTKVDDSFKIAILDA